MSKEEEERIAKEKKEKLDEIKKKYSKRGGSKRRILSAKADSQSALTGGAS